MSVQEINKLLAELMVLAVEFDESDGAVAELLVADRIRGVRDEILLHVTESYERGYEARECEFPIVMVMTDLKYNPVG